MYRLKKDKVEVFNSNQKILIASRFNVIVGKFNELLDHTEYVEVDPEEAEILNVLEYARSVTLSELAKQNLSKGYNKKQDAIIKHYNEIAKNFNL